MRRYAIQHVAYSTLDLLAAITDHIPNKFIEDPTVVRKILKHPGIWESKARPPPKKNISPCTGEPIPEECLSWAAETLYDNVDQVYED